MTRTEFIQQAYLYAMRKATPPSAAKADILLAIGNSLIDTWQNETNTDWLSLYQLTDIGTVSTTDRYPIDTDDIRKISVNTGDKVKVIATDGSFAEFDIVLPAQLDSSQAQVARVGDELVFSKAFDSDSNLIGGTIRVPNFGYAEKMVSANSEVSVDQPMWLVYMTAAEYVRNDYIKANQFTNLVAMAQDVMNSMKQNNRASQLNTIPRAPIVLGESW